MKISSRCFSRWLIVLIPVFTAFLFVACPIHAEEISDPLLDPAKAIEADGSITLSDGSSYYIFSKGGDFFSGPIGTTGRMLEGRWSQSEKGRFVVTAKRSWMGGLGDPSGETFHRILFFIGDGAKKPIRSERIPAIMEFSGYFLIEDFRVIPAPSVEKKPAKNPGSK